MTDIVEELRERERLQALWDMHDEPLWGAAADEIERLLEMEQACSRRLSAAQLRILMQSDEIEWLKHIVNEAAKIIECVGDGGMVTADELRIIDLVLSASRQEQENNR